LDTAWRETQESHDREHVTPYLRAGKFSAWNVAHTEDLSAERWTVDSTGAVWTFYLRDDARWHDGEPVTAEDVAFTIHVSDCCARSPWACHRRFRACSRL